MLKTFQSLTIILFLFSISFLPLTQITEAEAQFSNKIQKPTHPSEAIKKPIEINKAQNFKKIQKIPTPGASSIKEPKGHLIEKDILSDNRVHQYAEGYKKLLRLINDELLKELWIVDRINYLADAAINRRCEGGYDECEPNHLPISDGAGNMVEAGGIDPAPIFIEEIRSLLIAALQCDGGSDADPHDVPLSFTNPYCGSYDDYLNMFRTVWEPPFTHAYPLQASLAECGIPASNIGLSIPPDGWYWDRTKTERGYEVSGSRMPAMNDADGMCTRAHVRNGATDACDRGVPEDIYPASYPPSNMSEWLKENIETRLVKGPNDRRMGQLVKGKTLADGPSFYIKNEECSFALRDIFDADVFIDGEWQSREE